MVLKKKKVFWGQINLGDADVNMNSPKTMNILIFTGNVKWMGGKHTPYVRVCCDPTGTKKWNVSLSLISHGGTASPTLYH